jgi:hypothetical protein
MSSSVFYFSFFVYHDMTMLGSVTICSDTPSHVAVNHVALVLVLAVEIAFARRLRFASLRCSVGRGNMSLPLRSVGLSGAVFIVMSLLQASSLFRANYQKNHSLKLLPQVVTLARAHSDMLDLSRCWHPAHLLTITVIPMLNITNIDPTHCPFRLYQQIDMHIEEYLFDDFLSIFACFSVVGLKTTERHDEYPTVVVYSHQLERSAGDLSFRNVSTPAQPVYSRLMGGGYT